LEGTGDDRGFFKIAAGVASRGGLGDALAQSATAPDHIEDFGLVVRHFDRARTHKVSGALEGFKAPGSFRHGFSPFKQEKAPETGGA